MSSITQIMFDLENEIPLKLKHREHQLKGKDNHTECHIEPDRLLVYEIDITKKEIYFIRTGTHSDIF